MGKGTGHKEVVLQALVEHGLNLDESEDPNVFWISYKPGELEYEIEIELNYINKCIICFNSYLPFNLDKPTKNLFYFLNKINSQINFGKFFLQEIDNNVVYRRTHKFVSEKLTKEEVILHLRIVYTFPISYEKEFKKIFTKEDITKEEIDKILILRAERKELLKKN